jgi:hypothetical protein
MGYRNLKANNKERESKGDKITPLDEKEKQTSCKPS